MTRRGFIFSIATNGLANTSREMFDGFGASQLAKNAPDTVEPLKYSVIAEAYNATTIGKREPSLILMSPAVFERYLLLANGQHYSSIDREDLSVRFEAADACCDPTIPDNEVWLINEDHPEDPRLNSKIYVQ